MEMPDRSDFPGLYAGFWRRVLAWLIDILVLAFCVTVIGVIGSVFGIGFHGRQRVPIDVLVFVFAWLYFAIQESRSVMATIGKRVVHIQVVGDHGDRIPFRVATGRYLGSWLAVVTYGITFLIIVETRRQQALHDMLTHTFVVRAQGLEALRASPSPIKAGKGVPMLVLGGIVVGILLVIGFGYVYVSNAFHDYVGISEVETAYHDSRPIRHSIEGYVSKNGVLPPADVVAKMSVDHPKDILLGAILARRIGDHVAILPVFSSEAPRDFGGHDLFIEGALEGPATIVWTCHGRLSSPPIPTRYLPAICRH